MQSRVVYMSTLVRVCHVQVFSWEVQVAGWQARYKASQQQEEDSRTQMQATHAQEVHFLENQGKKLQLQT